LSQRAQYYKNLRRKGDPGLPGVNGKDTVDDAANYTIVANRLFMENTEKNNPKIVKANKHLYAL
jgi:hypothetical protein